MLILTAEEVLHASPPRTRRGVRASRLCVSLALAALVQLGCAARVESSRVERAAAATPAPSATPAEAKAEPAEVRIGDTLVHNDDLSYKGFTAQVWQRELKYGEAPGRAGKPTAAYAVLARGEKTLLTFDAGVYHGGLNSVGFGLFPFLGGEEKQLVVSQDAPREGRQWIVSLSPHPRVIYDGPAFEAGREGDDLRVVDLDGDGVYEVVALLCHFYGFRDWALAPNATPLPEIVFKYDAKARKYLPANDLFRERLLKDAEEKKAKVRGPAERESHTADVLSLVLAYVYAGEERAAWEFYEAAYKLPDKAELRKEIEGELRAEPVYRFVRAKSPRR